jgi:hypothetical protein
MKVCAMIAACISLLLTLPIIGCGGGSGSGGTATTITQTQALSATADIFGAMADATASAGYFEPGVGKAEATAIRNATPSASLIVPSIGEPRFVSPLTSITLGPYAFSCPAGGTIIVNGSVTGNSTSSSFNVTETINSCADGGITFNGNPNVTVSGNSGLSGNVFSDTVTMTGGFTYGSNSCTINVTVTATVNETTYAENGTVSGTVCGLNVGGAL